MPPIGSQPPSPSRRSPFLARCYALPIAAILWLTWTVVGTILIYFGLLRASSPPLPPLLLSALLAAAIGLAPALTAYPPWDHIPGG